ncbi:hypothetical protein SPSIL_014270 [Sporomusa silvacetica DSM 10669]|uniref:Uncharacterized protein n=1 Tax=Sporomusa silvacetica DSM 10669 TaxID=1123289 RepID=A0ABZ3IIT3_9FIRM|nr:hypothetical protein [Sporomusa silvacetica]OZC21490.1 hypothetical protein SPSIL_09000 [Sporomusa silvacetica DSM 10669]
MKCWPKIKELRLVVNIIKHAEGDSANKLRKLRPDYFKWPDGLDFGRDKLEFYKSSLLEETLNLSNNDFEEYYNTLIAFWDELPERMFNNE